jgi:serine protease AprX
MRLVAGLSIVLAAFGANTRVLASQPPPSKLDAALQAPPPGLVRVIVRTNPSQSAKVADNLRKQGRPVLKQYTVIDAVTTEVTAGDLVALQNDPAVAGISIDAAVASTAAPGPSSTLSTSTLLSTLNLPPAASGKGVGVAVLDSGLYLNGDFAGVSFYDFTSSVPSAPYDDFGHGTHVSGLIAGKGVLSQGVYAGVAPRARLIELKVLDAQGQSLTSTVISAIEFAIANKTTLGVDVINLSLGHPIFESLQTDPLVLAVEAAARAGIVVVVAAGNVGLSTTTGLPGYGGILSPANAPSAITVGALDTRNTTTRSDDVVAPYSSRGPTWYDGQAKPDLVAPGQTLISDAAIGSTLFTALPSAQVLGTGRLVRYMRLSGTSMAAAVTSGVAALVIEASRNASGVSPSPATVKAILAYTALPLSGVDQLTQGHGALNASGAVALAGAVGAASWPATNFDGLISPPTTTIGSETWTWAQQAEWSDTVVWGTTDGSSVPAWAQTVVWGSVAFEGDTVVWGTFDGDTVVWGTNDTVVWGTTNGVN